ncbi:MAG: hypothetical protein U9R60_04515 [Bacteroidota bacterium]|nr:hypothetical protein [Bacteroidota bacterium]
MNATNIDWVITGGFLILLSIGGFACKFFIKSTADWTVAGRNMRKFLGLSTGTAEGIGLMTLAVMSEVGFTSGFSYVGFSLINVLVVPVIYGLTGFVINRYREARVVTVPEYAQRRYGKGVRITTGGVLAFAGILNLAIFPIMASQFLTYFLNAQPHVDVMGLHLPFVPVLMAGLIGLALLFAYAGGMVSVILTDYIQSVIIAIAVFIITWLVISKVGFNDIHETINTNFGAGGYNPFVSNSFGPVFLIWIVLQQILGFPSFAPQMQKLASTDNARTARQMTMLSWLFAQGRALMIVVWGVAALAVMGPIAVGGIAPGLYPKVAGAIYLGQLIPPILFGFVLAGMLAAFISTVDSYLLTWSTVLVNDVISPLVRKPLTPKTHLWLLRIFVALIAILTYLFGIVYQPTESLLEFIILTGTMMLGSGIILIGGLYWKQASKAGAYAAVIFCGVIPVVNLILKRVAEDSTKIRAQDFGLAAIIIAILVFILFSVIIPDKKKERRN